MARDDYDPDDARTTRSGRRSNPPTDRLNPSEVGYDAQSSRNWRADRAQRGRRTSSMPFSRQEFALWLQHGGLRIVLIVGCVTGLLIAAILLWRGGRPLVRATPTPSPVAVNLPLLQSLPTVTPAISPTEVIAPQGTGGTGVGDGARFQVTGTGSEGLFLRPDHSTASNAIKTLPEGTIVTIVGEDFSGPDRVWKHIRDSEGTEGWAAADFLKPAQ
jgi:Bacterial SH3 domain